MSPAPACPDHGTEVEWMDGSPPPGYAEWFRPLGWHCAADPGHTPASSAPRRSCWCEAARLMRERAQAATPGPWRTWNRARQVASVVRWARTPHRPTTIRRPA